MPVYPKLYDVVPPNKKNSSDMPTRNDWREYWKTDGLGVLNDCVSAEVTTKRNGMCELTVVYKSDSPMSYKLSIGKIIRTLVNEEGTVQRGQVPWQPFRIYELSRTLTGHILVRAEHFTYALNGFFTLNCPANPISDKQYRKLDGWAYLREIWANTFIPDFGTKGEKSICQVTLQDELSQQVKEIKQDITKKTFLQAIIDGENSFLGVFGGEIIRDEFDLRIYPRATWQNEEDWYRIEYGYNMTALDLTYNFDKVATHYVPHCKAQFPTNINDKLPDGNFIPKDDWKYEQLDVSAHLAKAIFRDGNKTMTAEYKIINIIDVDFSDQEEQLQKAFIGAGANSTVPLEERKNRVRSKMIDLGEEWVRYTCPQMLELTCTVDFVALWQTEEYKNLKDLEKVNLHDYVKVYHPDIDFPIDTKVVGTTYDILKGRLTKIELASRYDGAEGKIKMPKL